MVELTAGGTRDFGAETVSILILEGSLMTKEMIT
jgi:hypothetical protein